MARPGADVQRGGQHQDLAWLTNIATLNNAGQFNNQLGGALINGGFGVKYENGVLVGADFNNQTSATPMVAADLSTVVMNNSGTLTNTGLVTNVGTLNNQSGGLIENKLAAGFSNVVGSFNNQAGSTFNNEGVASNIGGQFNNAGVVQQPAGRAVLHDLRAGLAARSGRVR